MHGGYILSLILFLFCFGVFSIIMDMIYPTEEEIFIEPIKTIPRPQYSIEDDLSFSNSYEYNENDSFEI